MKVLVIGSGPIVIGQAAEFDYAGTQACKSLKEEGHEVVLINSNPATIMTDPDVPDRLYIEPLTPEFCERVIARERPDAILPTLGGQTGLNLATQLADRGILEKYDLKLLGTPLSAIRKAEDRELFRALMREIREPVPESFIVENEEQLKAILPTEVPDENGRLIAFPYPRIVRPAYTLGGTGGGIAKDPDELWEIGRKGLKLSMRSQLMVERSLLGWKEVEYEVMRDSAGNCITVCNMENFDPMGVHTGDSIVVAPSQTLSDLEYHMLRTASLKIIQSLGIEGGCNVQLAVNPESFDYYVIEVNPRVSRSSALASKATGYPIARVAAKIAVGKTLDQIENQVTKTTRACFEPALDYVVVKIPRWPFDKFASGDRTLFTQMKATGEVMAIDRTFESALMKAIRGLEVKQKDLRHEKFGGSRSTAFQAVRTTGILPVGGSGFHPEPSSELEKRTGAKLPHWRLSGAVYNVCFRLADSVPSETRVQWKDERDLLEKRRASGALTEREYFRLSWLEREKVQQFLDAGKGSCVLRQPEAAKAVQDALLHFDGERYVLHAWCVMPNHVHAVVEPIGSHELSEILHSWKSFTSKRINELLGQKGHLWESESYDHIIRDNEDYDRIVAYVLDNPNRSDLQAWPWVGSRSLDELKAARRDFGLEARSTHGQDGHATTSAIPPMSDLDLRDAIRQPTDERLWAIAEGLRRGWGVDEVNRLCRVDKWFLNKLKNLLEIERQLLELPYADELPDVEALIVSALLAGFAPSTIDQLLGITPEFKTHQKEVSDRLNDLIRPEMSTPLAAQNATAGKTEAAYRLAIDQFEANHPEEGNARAIRLMALMTLNRFRDDRVFKMVDTCAGEFESKTPYFYGAFEEEDDAERPAQTVA